MPDTMNDRAVLIAGATSGIARALATELARQGARLYLTARDVEEAERIGRDLHVRYGAEVSWDHFEAEDYDAHALLLQGAKLAMGRLDGVIVAAGHLGDQARAQANFDHARRSINANFTGVASLLTHAANLFEQQGEGFIVALSSVAGDRGRQSNYVYGAAKGALSLFLQGLRNRLAPKGVHVLTVKPGFVDTRMTFGKAGLFLVAQPEAVARDVLRALGRRKDVLYTPGFWRWIMRAVRAIPESRFKRMAM